MKAALYDRYGSPSVLELREVAEPVPGPGELAVRVNALRRRINESLHADFGIEHSTLQVESSDCGVQDCGRES